MGSNDIRHIAVCEAKGIRVPRDATILDFGCGEGRRIYQLVDAGYENATGFDVLEYLDLRDPADRDRFHIAPNGRIPLPDGSFDFVFSDEVFEHVMNQPLAFQEILRVLRPGGVTVHIIPAKWQLIEPHIKVPLGGLAPFKRYSYYLFWAKLGVRNEFQHHLSASEVADRNYPYALRELNYWSTAQYERLFRTLPVTWSWEEGAWMEASYKPSVRRLGQIARKAPWVTSLIRTFMTRVLFLVKSYNAKNDAIGPSHITQQC